MCCYIMWGPSSCHTVGFQTFDMPLYKYSSNQLISITDIYYQYNLIKYVCVCHLEFLTLFKSKQRKYFKFDNKFYVINITFWYLFSFMVINSQYHVERYFVNNTSFVLLWTNGFWITILACYQNHKLNIQILMSDFNDRS